MKATLLRIGIALGIFLSSGLQAGRAAEAVKEIAKEITVPLTYEGGTILNAFTPARVVRGAKSFSLSGSESSLSVAGTNVLIGSQKVGAETYIGVDSDGSGTLDKREFTLLSRTKPMVFDLKLPGDSGTKPNYCVKVYNISSYITQGNPKPHVGGLYACNCCRKGTVNGTTVRLVDDNLDGKFTQDGEDAIIIGDTPAAMPLKKLHQIGDRIYRLQVSPDGSSLTATPAADLKLGLIETAFKSVAAKAIFVESAEGAFDLTKAKKGIPEGEYKLSYGILAAGTDGILFGPSRTKPLMYPIEGDKINVLRMGHPFRIDFNATTKASSVVVAPNLRVVGAGDEVYAVTFSASIKPHVAMLSGDKVLSEASMAFG